jgi:hypothetical protein
MTSVGTSTPSTGIASGIAVVPSVSRASGSTSLSTVNCSATCLPRRPPVTLRPMPTEVMFGSSRSSGPRARMYRRSEAISLSSADAVLLADEAVFFLVLVAMTGLSLRRRGRA